MSSPFVQLLLIRGKVKRVGTQGHETGQET